MAEDEIATALTEPSAAEPTALDTAAALVLTSTQNTPVSPRRSRVEGADCALHLVPPETSLRPHLERTAPRESKTARRARRRLSRPPQPRERACAAVGALAQRTFLCAPPSGLRPTRTGSCCGLARRSRRRLPRTPKLCGASGPVRRHPLRGVRRCDSRLRPYKHDRSSRRVPRGARRPSRRVHIRRALRRRRRLPTRPRGVRRPLRLCVRDRRRVPRDVHAEFWCARARRRRLRRVRAGSTALDLLTAGFPCQPFSERGEQAGLACRKGGMDLELVRILKVCQPKAFLFENVPALATLGGGDGATAGAVLAAMRGGDEGAIAGSVLATMLAAFEGAGYRVSWRVLNARRWVAQKRRRLYIVGFRSDTNAAASAFERLTTRCRAPAGAARRPRAARFGVGRAVRSTAAQWEAAQSRRGIAARGCSSPTPPRRRSSRATAPTSSPRSLSRATAARRRVGSRRASAAGSWAFRSPSCGRSRRESAATRAPRRRRRRTGCSATRWCRRWCGRSVRGWWSGCR